MPGSKRNTPFWINLAAKAAAKATRLGRQMRDEWHEGQAEASQSDGTVPPEASMKQPPAEPCRSWWEVLQVPRSASKEEVQQAWRRMIKEHHPDKAFHLSAEMQTELENETKRLNEAYEHAMKEK